MVDSQLRTNAVNDPRVTAVGRFLRRYSVDEIPNTVNVLLVDIRADLAVLASGKY